VGNPAFNRKNMVSVISWWEVRIVKNYDQGLENAVRVQRPRPASSSPRSQFYTIQADSKLANNGFIFSCNKLASKQVWLPNLIIELVHVP